MTGCIHGPKSGVDELEKYSKKSDWVDEIIAWSVRHTAKALDKQGISDMAHAQVTTMTALGCLAWESVVIPCLASLADLLRTARPYQRNRIYPDSSFSIVLLGFDVSPHTEDTTWAARDVKAAVVPCCAS